MTQEPTSDDQQNQNLDENDQPDKATEQQDQGANKRNGKGEDEGIVKEWEKESFPASDPPANY
ncbi:hypothetical protein ACF046_13025 [Glutamicibacter creatinolyticus]|uniref:hypothetical protein n=1 Tax=Glutamicibacter creatinolyticus TaxID=162496 RepID=UPI0033EE0548